MPKIKACIVVDELFPYLVLEIDKKGGGGIEIDEKLYQRYLKAEKETDKIQTILAGLIGE